jgi:hypothetical protein
MMTERNFTKELLYTYYADMENGDDVESIDYRSLIHIITELCDRIEQLEKVNAAMKAVEKLYEENGDALKRLAEIEMEEYTDEQIKQWNEND